MSYHSNLRAFNAGQRRWDDAHDDSGVNEIVECEECEGSGKLKESMDCADGRVRIYEFDCPTCQGAGKEIQ